MRRLARWARALVVLAVILSSLLGGGDARAETATVDPQTIGQDMEQLSKDLVTDPKLESLDGLSYEHLLGDDRAIAVQEWLEQLYHGTDTGVSDALYHGAGGPNWTAVDEYLAKLKAATETLTDGGATEAEIAGEALDTAGADGILTGPGAPAAVGAGAAVAMPVVLAGGLGYLTYMDITTGTNPVTSSIMKIFSPSEDANSESGSGTAPIAMRWFYVPKCSKAQAEGGASGTGKRADTLKACVTYQKEEGHIPNKEHEKLQASYWGTGNGETVEDPHVGMYVLAPEFTEAGEFQLGAQAYTNPKTGVYADPYNPGEGKACETGYSWEVVPGFPFNVKHRELDGGTEGTQAIDCGAIVEGKYEEIWRSKDLSVLRQPSKMHVGVPRSGNVPSEHDTHVTTRGVGETGGLESALTLPEMVHGSREMLGKYEPFYGEHLELSHWIDHNTAGAGGTAPEPGTITVPSCAGLGGAACVSKLEGEGLKTSLQTLTWQTADVSKAASEVVELNPREASEVETGTVVTVTQNPATMPLVVPQPQINEAYTQYATQLQTAGLTDPVKTTLTEAEADPNTGPGDVVKVSPAPGTRVDPTLGPTTEIKVQTNPETSTNTEPGQVSGGEGGGLFTPPKVPALVFPKIATPCGLFPFGVPCWLYEQTRELVVASKPPTWSLKVFTGTLKLEGSRAESLMEILRPVLLFVACLGLVSVVASWARKGSDGGAGGGGEE